MGEPHLAKDNYGGLDFLFSLLRDLLGDFSESLLLVEEVVVVSILVFEVLDDLRDVLPALLAFVVRLQLIFELLSPGSLQSFLSIQSLLLVEDDLVTDELRVIKSNLSGHDDSSYISGIISHFLDLAFSQLVVRSRLSTGVDYVLEVRFHRAALGLGGVARCCVHRKCIYSSH